jgi:hypothetical protein
MAAASGDTGPRRSHPRASVSRATIGGPTGRTSATLAVGSPSKDGEPLLGSADLIVCLLICRLASCDIHLWTLSVKRPNT